MRNYYLYQKKHKPKSNLILVIGLLAFSAVLFFTNSSKPFKNPLINFIEPTKQISNLSVKEFGNILGLKTDIQNNLQPEEPKELKNEGTEERKNVETEEKKNQKKEEPSSTPTITSIPTPVPTISDMQLLKQKTLYIENSVLNNQIQSNPEILNNIVVQSLLTFYGLEKFVTVFDIQSITFINLQINQNQATAEALLTRGNETLKYLVYFLKQNNDWFLYKTEEIK
ncbi:hypothetical protein COV24_02875 [candidate division WWE3 bacterium CG10_big_fil_rev_8_21_14_0_10_32_10]|uniref:Uncharacterized protein n=1 Tax=candidate division WWE3 bacterium CG10_big_fil_rev_8_21_14_0_10_32_10 TaxID=1975090 RepID=A0A2H0RC17_UNCKA|nr:MAG: hypothetical protein COV24_02875 [candidate division WWE3 bacterium CG10_big_fil_rev_8_21_14_0_10_32_10]